MDAADAEKALFEAGKIAGGLAAKLAVARHALAKIAKGTCGDGQCRMWPCVHWIADQAILETE